MLMHLSYDFKQKLGLEWTTDRDFLKNYKDVLQKNRNAIKREFIRQSLAEKSVNFAKGLQGILEIFVSDQFPQVKETITKELDDKYAKQRDNLRKKIEDLKGDVKKVREAEEKAKKQAEAKSEEAAEAPAESQEPAPEVEAPAEEQATVEQPETTGAVVIDGVKVAEVNHVDATEPEQEAPAEQEAEPAKEEKKTKKNKKGGKK